MRDISQDLDELGISYKKYEHPAVFTMEEAGKYDSGDGAPSKNLFLKNKRGTKHYLIILDGSKRVDFKKLESQLQEDGLSFASPERMMKYLGITTGAVSPFGLINDSNKEVIVIVDQALLKFDKQSFHPNVNTATLVINTPDFKKFLEWTKNKIVYLNL